MRGRGSVGHWLCLTVSLDFSCCLIDTRHMTTMSTTTDNFPCACEPAKADQVLTTKQTGSTVEVSWICLGCARTVYTYPTQRLI
jgi:hypothetical protein